MPTNTGSALAFPVRDSDSRKEQIWRTGSHFRVRTPFVRNWRSACPRDRHGRWPAMARQADRRERSADVRPARQHPMLHRHRLLVGNAASTQSRAGLPYPLPSDGTTARAGTPLEGGARPGRHCETGRRNPRRPTRRPRSPSSRHSTTGSSCFQHARWNAGDTTAAGARIPQRPCPRHRVPYAATSRD